MTGSEGREGRGTRIVVVTGTSTDVGKTIATAALAVTAAASGRVVVVKPAQTGIADALPGDADVVHTLTGVDVETWTMLDEPLAPDTAARRAGVPLPPVTSYVPRVLALASSYDVVVVEGAGGLLVRLDTDGGTVLDLAVGLTEAAGADPVVGVEDEVVVEVVVVCSAGLGTLNHAELTVGAMRARGLEPHALVIGAWPASPDLAETCNRDDLPRVTGVPLLAVLPAGAGRLSPSDFAARAPTWFAQRG